MYTYLDKKIPLYSVGFTSENTNLHRMAFKCGIDQHIACYLVFLYMPLLPFPFSIWVEIP